MNAEFKNAITSGSASVGDTGYIRKVALVACSLDSAERLSAMASSNESKDCFACESYCPTFYMQNYDKVNEHSVSVFMKHAVSTILPDGLSITNFKFKRFSARTCCDCSCNTLTIAAHLH